VGIDDEAVDLSCTQDTSELAQRRVGARTAVGERRVEEVELLFERADPDTEDSGVRR